MKNFSEDDIHFLEGFGIIIGNAIERIHSQVEHKKLIHRLDKAINDKQSIIFTFKLDGRLLETSIDPLLIFGISESAMRASPLREFLGEHNEIIELAIARGNWINQFDLVISYIYFIHINI